MIIVTAIALTMEAVNISETSIIIYQTTWRNIPEEDSHLHARYFSYSINIDQSNSDFLSNSTNGFLNLLMRPLRGKRLKEKFHSTVKICCVSFFCVRRFMDTP
jgi:hypothetical protein